MIALFILVGVLYGIRKVGRNGNGENILAWASPGTSAFQMYYFNGETVVVRTLYDKDEKKEFIKDDTLNVLNFPNAGLLAAYHNCFLLKADEPPAEGLSMTIEDIGTSEITVLITNNSREEFSYGEYFSVQK